MVGHRRQGIGKAVARLCCRFGGTGGVQEAQSAAPGNDNFANAQSLASTSSGSVAGSNVDATFERGGEPAHNLSPGGHSIWYKWTAPSDGAVRAHRPGISDNAILAVYRASRPPLS